MRGTVKLIFADEEIDSKDYTNSGGYTAILARWKRNYGMKALEKCKIVNTITEKPKEVLPEKRKYTSVTRQLKKKE